MPNYHFTPREARLNRDNQLDCDRVKALYTSGIFDRADYLTPSQNWTIKDVEGSLAIIDRQRPGINKVHIGNLVIKHPHVESYEEPGVTGPRVDLHLFDLSMAEKRLAELEDWRNPRAREALIATYIQHGWYSVEPRLRQLAISPTGLEKEIERTKELVAILRRTPRNTFVSQTIALLEERYQLIKEAMDSKVKDAPQKSKKDDKPRIIVAPAILAEARQIRDSLTALLDFITPNIDLSQARKYWTEIASWKYR